MFHSKYFVIIQQLNYHDSIFIDYNGNGFINLIFDIKVKQLILLIFLFYMSVKSFSYITYSYPNM